jgi:hypothetical protein
MTRTGRTWRNTGRPARRTGKKEKRKENINTKTMTDITKKIFTAKDFKANKATGFVILSSDNTWLHASISSTPEELAEELEQHAIEIMENLSNGEVDYESAFIYMTVGENVELYQ